MARGNLVRPIGFRGFDFNSAFDEDGEQVKEDVGFGDFTRVDLFDFSRMQQRDQREGLHLLSGGDFGVATDVFRFISVQGVISASNDNEEDLEDQQSRLIRACHVEEAQIDSPSTVGADKLDFWTPTAHAPRGMRSPVHEYFMCRPVAYPALYERYGSGMSVRYAAEFVAADPRRYLYDETKVVFNGTLGWSQVVPNWTLDMGHMVFPLIDVVTTASGAANFTINAGGSAVLILDLSSAGAVNFTIDTFTGTITKQNGDRKDDWRTSSVATIPFGIPAGGATWQIGHTTGVSRVTVRYHQCRG